jgi:hypothetical protein
LASLLADVVDHSVDLLSTADRCEQVARIWQIAETEAGKTLRAFLVGQPALLTATLTRVIANPTHVKSMHKTMTFNRRFDLSIELRAELLVSMANALPTDEILNLLENVVTRLFDQWDKGYPEYEDAISLLHGLEASNDPKVHALYGPVKEALIPEFRYALSSQFEALVSFAQESSQWTEADNAALTGAFGDYLDEAFDDEQRESSGSGELAGLRNSVQKIGNL